VTPAVPTEADLAVDLAVADLAAVGATPAVIPFR
jgi:hypothetical protein